MVYFSISYAGIDEHIAGIRDELRDVQRLKDQLYILCTNAEREMVDPKPFQMCANELKKVEESMQWRMQFLNDLIEELQHMNLDIGTIIDKMNIHGGINGQ